MNKPPECDICGRSEGVDLFCYGIPELRKLSSSWYGDAACTDCQQKWIERHTVICCDCGTGYVTVNVGVARRCDPCAKIYNSRVSAVSTEKKRAKDKGLSSTMKRSDWVVTLDHFGNQCAYCSGPYEVIEHFSPVVNEGGTDPFNCIPACSRCNRIKGTLDGRTQREDLSERLGIPISQLLQIEDYLNQF